MAEIGTAPHPPSPHPSPCHASEQMICHQSQTHDPFITEKKKPFFILPSPIFLLTLSCPSWAQAPQVKTCSAHVSDLPVFQNLHDPSPIFAASRYGAWLAETALSSSTPCLCQTDWSAIYSMITHSDPKHTAHAAASRRGTRCHHHGTGAHQGGIAAALVKHPPVTNLREMCFWSMSEKKMEERANIGDCC